MRMFVLKKLTRKTSGEMIPCHNPTQNPAGFVPAILYLEFGPAINSMFGDVLAFVIEKV